MAMRVCGKLSTTKESTREIVCRCGCLVECITLFFLLLHILCVSRDFRLVVCACICACICARGELSTAKGVCRTLFAEMCALLRASNCSLCCCALCVRGGGTVACV